MSDESIKGYDIDTIESAWDETVKEMGRMRNALTMSSPVHHPYTEQGYEKGEPEIKGFARFGDQMAVNERPVDEMPDFSGYKKLSQGGKIPTMEAELEVDQIADAVTDKFEDLTKEDVVKAVEKAKDIDIGNLFYTTASGYAEYYVKDKNQRQKQKLDKEV